jgi:hypothetical protein
MLSQGASVERRSPGTKEKPSPGSSFLQHLNVSFLEWDAKVFIKEGLHSLHKSLLKYFLKAWSFLFLLTMIPPVYV